MKKLSTKTKIEILVGKAVITLFASVLGIALILGFFWLVGLLQLAVESHPILWIPLIAIALWSIFKMASEAE